MYWLVVVSWLLVFASLGMLFTRKFSWGIILALTGLFLAVLGTGEAAFYSTYYERLYNMTSNTTYLLQSQHMGVYVNLSAPLIYMHGVLFFTHLLLWIFTMLAKPKPAIPRLPRI